MFSLLDKKFLCCVLDIVLVFAGRLQLVVDNWAPFDNLAASVFAGNVSVFASKLDIDGWAPFNGLVEASERKSGIELVPCLTLSLMQ